MSGEEVEAVVARLKEELRASASIVGAGTGPVGGVARDEAERFWAVAPDRPFGEWPGWRGAIARWGWRGLLKRVVLVPVKLVVRRLIRWYVDPIAVHQQRFNAALLQVCDQLARRLESELAELKEAPSEDAVGSEERARESARVAELEQRLMRLERRR